MDRLWQFSDVELVELFDEWAWRRNKCLWRMDFVGVVEAETVLRSVLVALSGRGIKV